MADQNPTETSVFSPRHAGVVRVHGSRKALAITTDCTPRYC